MHGWDVESEGLGPCMRVRYLGEAVDSECTRPHVRQGSKAEVLMWREDDVLVDLVAEHQQAGVTGHHGCQLNEQGGRVHRA